MVIVHSHVNYHEDHEGKLSLKFPFLTPMAPIRALTIWPNSSGLNVSRGERFQKLSKGMPWCAMINPWIAGYCHLVANKTHKTTSLYTRSWFMLPPRATKAPPAISPTAPCFSRASDSLKPLSLCTRGLGLDGSH